MSATINTRVILENTSTSYLTVKFYMKAWLQKSLLDSGRAFHKCNLHAFHCLQSLMLSIAKGLLEEEAKENEQERIRWMEENCPPLSLPGGTQQLMVNQTTNLIMTLYSSS
jgi:hypothetical protein